MAADERLMGLQTADGGWRPPRLVAQAGGFGFLFVEFDVLGLAGDDVQVSQEPSLALGGKEFAG